MKVYLAKKAPTCTELSAFLGVAVQSITIRPDGSVSLDIPALAALTDTQKAKLEAKLGLTVTTEPIEVR